MKLETLDERLWGWRVRSGMEVGGGAIKGPKVRQTLRAAGVTGGDGTAFEVEVRSLN